MGPLELLVLILIVIFLFGGFAISPLLWILVGIGILWLIFGRNYVGSGRSGRL